MSLTSSDTYPLGLASAWRKAIKRDKPATQWLASELVSELAHTCLGVRKNCEFLASRSLGSETSPQPPCFPLFMSLAFWCQTKTNRLLMLMSSLLAGINTLHFLQSLHDRLCPESRFARVGIGSARAFFLHLPLKPRRGQPPQLISCVFLRTSRIDANLHSGQSRLIRLGSYFKTLGLKAYKFNWRIWKTPQLAAAFVTDESLKIPWNKCLS